MMAATLESTATRVQRVRERLAQAEVAAGRAPGSVRLVAVSKTHSPRDCIAAIAAGVVDLGENRVQECEAKATLVADEGHQPQWHLIGPLQSNKVAKVADQGWWLHGLDRASIIDKVARASSAPAAQTVLIQVNVANDPAKSGCTIDQAPALVERAVVAGLDVRGLMTIPPMAPSGVDATQDARRHFATLRELAVRLQRDHPQLVELSMGMSADLEGAVAEGATLVRIGTAVFGTRGDGPWMPGR